MNEARPENHRVRRGAYLLPSLFTMGNMFLGFYAIVRSTRGDFQTAALLIFVAGVLDGFDGRIARMTRTESEFGKEYDSLADVLTFGASPALLAYFWGLQELGRPGWLLPVFYLVCTATRLARFNVQTRVVDSRWFVGLPSPAAAGVIASFLFVAPEQDSRVWFGAAMMVALAVAGSLMLSTFRYPSFKRIDLRKRWSYRGVLPLAAIALVLVYHPQAFFLTAALLYSLSGPTAWLVGRLRRRDDEADASVEPAGEETFS